MSVQYRENAGNSLQRITISPDICHGKPCIRGLRYPVETILELLIAGMSFDDLLSDYEDLEYPDLLAALAFATSIINLLILVIGLPPLGLIFRGKD